MTDADDAKQKLAKSREQIDSIDVQVQDLINQRADHARRIAELKRAIEGSSEDQVAYYRPEREAQILRSLGERNAGPVPDQHMVRIFREIMSACLALEQPLRVAYLGPAGTFTQAAALKHFGHAVECSPLNTIDEVFREVESGGADHGVVPVENSTEGMVNHTLDCFMNSTLKICGEVALPIHHHLLVKPGTKPDSISRIYSHQQSLAQCRKWLDGHWPRAERIAVNSNAEAARRMQTEWHAAAIAGDMAAEMYGLEKIASNIEDRPDNSTRFLVIGRDAVPPSGDDKTSIIVSTRDRPGALHDLLEPFHRRSISLTRLETRPSPASTWAYVFFIDFEGHRDQENISEVLHELGSNGANVTNLGSYPRAVL